ncbi:MAG: hypothetical protein ACRC5C_06930, partial [Bacilli bacterium]
IETDVRLSEQKPELADYPVAAGNAMVFNGASRFINIEPYAPSIAIRHNAKIDDPNWYASALKYTKTSPTNGVFSNHAFRVQNSISIDGVSYPPQPFPTNPVLTFQSRSTRQSDDVIYAPNAIFDSTPKALKTDLPQQIAMQLRTLVANKPVEITQSDILQWSTTRSVIAGKLASYMPMHTGGIPSTLSNSTLVSSNGHAPVNVVMNSSVTGAYDTTIIVNGDVTLNVTNEQLFRANLIVLGNLTIRGTTPNDAIDEPDRLQSSGAFWVTGNTIIDGVNIVYDAPHFASQPTISPFHHFLAGMGSIELRNIRPSVTGKRPDNSNTTILKNDYTSVRSPMQTYLYSSQSLSFNHLTSFLHMSGGLFSEKTVTLTSRTGDVWDPSNTAFPRIIFEKNPYTSNTLSRAFGGAKGFALIVSTYRIPYQDTLVK